MAEDTKFKPLPERGLKRQKANYIGAPAAFALELAIRPIIDAFGNDDDPYSGVYVVGSCLERQDWRDVDVRFMMGDEKFYKLFPDARKDHWEFDPRWLLLTVMISKLLSEQTGLPIDFQFQPASHANTVHMGNRHALGLSVALKNK